MIFLDLSQVLYSNIAMSIKKNDFIEESIIRYMVLNTIRSNLMKFRSKFGNLVIAVDSKDNWRKEFFPYYKSKRALNRNKSLLNWNKIFEIMDKLKEEFKENLSFPFIAVECAEADDIIGVFVREFSLKCQNLTQPHLILSGDKDYAQLHQNINIFQYDPVRKKEIKVTNSDLVLKEHIFRGDSGDGIPNVLSNDDCFIVGRRQTPLTKTQLAIWLEQDASELPYEVYRNYKRNEILIDLNNTPDKIQTAINFEYTTQLGKTNEKLFGYFTEHKLKNLMENLQDFL